MFGEKEWYFFSPRDRKYPNGSRPNRVAGSGYWKATGTDKIITTRGRKVGIKKALVFYVGKAPKGTKTDWIMHEYRLSQPPKKNGGSKLDDWVLCRIYKKNSSCQRPILGVPSKEDSQGSPSSTSSLLDDLLDSSPEMDYRLFNFPKLDAFKSSQLDEKLNLHELDSGNFDWATLARLTSLPEVAPIGQAPAVQIQVPMNNNSNQTDACVPSIPQLCQVDSRFGCDVHGEFHSGLRTHLADSGYSQRNSIACYSNSLNQFGIPYPTESGV